MSGVLLESKPFRPFKSSEEYLYAMKEDLAEWFHLLYPHLDICTNNFMEKLETGVALCEHANSVKLKAYEYIEKKQQARKTLMMTRSVTGSLALAQTVYEIPDVKYFSTAKPGTFFARDNLSNFIQWCKHLDVHECLLFESDDLILRKNEKNVILCLLEVARRGAKFGMLAPMLIQMERQIDREIAADQRRSGYANHSDYMSLLSDGTDTIADDLDETDSEMEDEQPPVLVYGPIPQIVTNDLKSLDEMVRDLVEMCTCPTQFPMIRVSEGKYRIGDTKVLIFVRILRNHVMVRVGGGWDTLSHYLDKHDPCRCRAQHRQTQGARLVNKPGAADLAGAQVYYDRSPQRQLITNGASETVGNKKDYLGPPMNSLNRSRSRSPSYNNETNATRRSASPNLHAANNRRYLYAPADRSRSPTPNFTSTHVTKLSRSPQKTAHNHDVHHHNGHTNYLDGKKQPQHHQQQQNVVISAMQIPLKSEATLVVGDANDHSDNASEVSDEGYRSLGIVDKSKLRASLCSQNSTEDAEETEHQTDYIDDTNDCGLRKTSFSRIFADGDKQRPLNHSTPKPDVAPTDSKSIRSRSNSIDRTNHHQPSPRRTIPTKVPHSALNNTWNGRPKQQRPSLNMDIYSSPTSSPTSFNRNATTRRSMTNNVQYDNNGRRLSQSANTSPTKTNLRQELMTVLKTTNDEEMIAREVQKLVKQYSMTNLFADDVDCCSTKRKNYNNNAKRKDSRADIGASKIPVPLTHKGF